MSDKTEYRIIPLCPNGCGAMPCECKSDTEAELQTLRNKVIELQGRLDEAIEDRATLSRISERLAVIPLPRHYTISEIISDLNMCLDNLPASSRLESEANPQAMMRVVEAARGVIKSEDQWERGPWVTEDAEEHDKAVAALREAIDAFNKGEAG